jgi:hypothetical protein
MVVSSHQLRATSASYTSFDLARQQHAVTYESIDGISFTLNMFKEASLQPGLGFDNFKPKLKREITSKCIS